MTSRSPQASAKKGFTIVELLVVIAVIGILAAITIIGFGAWHKNVIASQVKSDLNGAATAMENAKNFGSGYPTTIPSTFTASDGVVLTGGGSGDGKTYCIDGTSTKEPSVLYYIDQASQGAQVGTCATRPIPPTTPAGLAATGASATAINLSWSAVSGATGYTIQRATDAGFSTVVTITVGSVTGTQSTGLSGGVVYYYRINATNASGTSDWSTSVNAATKSWIQIAGGEAHRCAIASDNEAYCWGDNIYGDLGSSGTTAAVDTTGVLSGKTIKLLSQGAGYYSCAIASDNQAYCWGQNYEGQIGNNTTTNALAPVPVVTSGVLSGLTLKAITSGYYHTCAIASDNQAYCWGYNSTGQLGNNSTTNSSVPVAVTTSGALSGKTLKSISAGYYHTCAIASDNQAYCWGYATWGQIGNNSTYPSPMVPTAVTTTGVLSGKTIVSLVTGSYHTCAIASDNQAYCWGRNDSGQLGNNSTTSTSVPVAVTTSGVLSGKTIKSITGGYAHTCAIASDNKAYCWGDNTYGQLGNNSTTDSLVPVAVSTVGALSGKTLVSISAGYYHTCAIASDGQVYCWGYNAYGQLGDGTTTNSLVPILTPSSP